MKNNFISFFDPYGNIVIKPSDKEDKKICTLFSKILKGEHKAYSKLSDLHKEVIDYRINFFAKEAIESFLFCEDISLSEIAEILETQQDVIEEYGYWFCNVGKIKTYFQKKIWIETQLKEIKEKLELTGYRDEILLNELKSILFKRWALLLGKEFVIWKFGLKKITVSPSNFLETIAKEAFFHYKEISLSEKDLEHNEYAKLINSLVKTIKEINSVMSQSANNDDIVTSIKEALEVVLVEEEPKKQIPQLDGDIVCNSKIN